MPGTRLPVGAAHALLAAVLLCAIAPDAAAQVSQGQILVSDRLGDAVIRIDPVTGDQTPLDLGGSINSPFAMGFDGDGFVYLTSTNGAVWRVLPDPVSGSQSLIRFGVPLSSPRGITVAPTEGVCTDSPLIACTNDFDCRCDQETGLCLADDQIVCTTDDECPGTCNHFASNGTIFLAENPFGPVQATIWTIDPVTGAIGTASSGGFLGIPLGLAREDTGKLLATDASTISPSSVLRIDPEAFNPNNPDGNQSVVSDGGMIVTPWRLALQKESGETTAIFVADFGGFPLGGSGHCSVDDLRECFEDLDCVSPETCVFEDFEPQILCIDANPDPPFDPDDRVASPADRAAGVFQNQNRVTSGGFFIEPVGIALENPGTPGVADSGSLLVANPDSEAIIRVTFTPGAPCPVPDSGTQTILSQGGDLDLPWDLQIVPEPNPFEPRPYFVSDAGPGGDGAVYYVDRSTDTRTEILPDTFTRPSGLTLDLDGNLVVADEALGQVFRIIDPRGLAGGPTLETLVAASGADYIESPTGVVVDAEGDVLVIDRAAPGAVVRVRPDGSQVLIDLRDLDDPSDLLAGPILATLGPNGLLIVAVTGDEMLDPRLVQVDPASGLAIDVPPPLPPLPPLFDVAADADGSNLISAKGGPGSERLVRQLTPITDPTYRIESSSDDFQTPRGIDIDLNRSVLVVDAGDESPDTIETSPILSVDSLSPADTSPAPVPTGGDLYDPFDVIVDIVRPRPILDLDLDGIPDGRDNCALAERFQLLNAGSNPPSVCSGDDRTPCTLDEDECAAQDLGSCLQETCAGDGSTQCSDASDCVLDLGACIDAVCSGDGTTACVDNDECDALGLGFCLDKYCSGDGTQFCDVDASCAAIGAGVCVDMGCSGDPELSCSQDLDCQDDIGPCLDQVCSADEQTACDPDLGICEFLGLEECVQLDEDGDGRGNNCDNCQLLANTDPDNPQFAQLDTDQDGFGDACDPTCDISDDGLTSSVDFVELSRFLGFDGACSLDGLPCSTSAPCGAQSCDMSMCSLDGLPCADASDCSAQTCDPTPADCTGDGTVNGADFTELSLDLGTSLGPSLDFDQDFLADEFDNCLDVPNPSICSLDGNLCDREGVGYENPEPCPGTQTCAQPDADQDGFGDACNDNLPVFGDIDLDNDEIADGLDTCPSNPNDGRCSLSGDACRFNLPCPTGETCQLIGQTCDGTRIADGGMPCAFDGDCPSGETCQQPDEDDDTIGDACDACPDSPEPSLCTLGRTVCTVDADCDQTCDPVELTCSADGAACTEDADCAPDPCIFDPDPDGDEIQNTCDICPDDFDPRLCEDQSGTCRFDDDCPSGVACLPQADLDGDGDGDACDPDVDGDTIPDNFDGVGMPGDTPCTGGATADCDDNCPTVVNAGQEDADGDGVGDACDVCPQVDDPLQVDADSDGAGDACDNCALEPNDGRCSLEGSACRFDLQCPEGETCEHTARTCDGIRIAQGGMPCTFDADCSGAETCQQPDADTDTIGDACDSCPGSPEPVLLLCSTEGTVCADDDDCPTGETCDFVPDKDGDDIQNSCDICPDDPNPRICADNTQFCRFDTDCISGATCDPQANLDGDPFGDACDPDVDGDSVDDDGDGSGTAGDTPCPDGVTVGCDDNCPTAVNPGQEDADGDGVGDACDSCPSDPNGPLCSLTGSACLIDADCLLGETCQQPDVDGDGAGNACDNCVSTPNARLCSLAGSACLLDADCPGGETCVQPDADTDTIGDACDVCPQDADPGQEDGDTDGAGDACDNCLSDPNGRECSLDGSACQLDSDCPGGETCQQPDADADTIGDVCDPDADGDGIDDDGDGSGTPGDNPCPDGVTAGCDDNCPLAMNPGQEDAEGDGVGDACDNCTDVPNPDQFDASADGVGRACDADATNDGVVLSPDFVALSVAFGSSTGDPEYDPDLDSDASGSIGAPDFVLLSTQFGGPPGPGKPNCDGVVPVPPGCDP